MRCQEKGKNPFDIASEKTDVTVRQISADQWNTQAFLAIFAEKCIYFSELIKRFKQETYVTKEE